MGNDEKPKVMATEGNTLLHVYGHWLFEAVQNDKQAFEEGTALALKILCNIFTSRPLTPYLPVYLSSFYSCLTEALKKDGRVMISAVMNSQRLFQCELQGLRTLVPSFVYAIARILQKKVENYDKIEAVKRVRKASIKILTSLFSLPNHFAATKFQHRTTSTRNPSNPLEVETYSQLKPFITTILIDALKNEEYPSNIIRLLYTAFSYQCDDIHSNSDFSKQLINIITRSSTTGSWNKDVSVHALRVLSMMTILYPHMLNADEEAALVTLSLCKYIMNHCDKPELEADKTESLICEIYYCLGHWILVDSQWILKKERSFIELTMKAIVAGLSFKTPRKRKETEEVRQ
eukprot:TRINITY_DN5886_c0_g2_i1.p1 TRINITY_DN5886_c0_g2~~TRINITY_DN5886_c0_g2_i1.p1  ORF type:complete len:347 (+),score=61.88 TRINITY_DN5886_c0_g2_i1:29-1069(+)